MSSSGWPFVAALVVASVAACTGGAAAAASSVAAIVLCQRRHGQCTKDDKSRKMPVGRCTQDVAVEL